MPKESSRRAAGRWLPPMPLQPAAVQRLRAKQLKLLCTPTSHPPGLYYPQGSLKARLCVAGRQQLYAFCAAHGVPHRRLGKLLVASSPAQLDALSALAARAAANGVHDLRPLGKAEVGRLEPAVRCEAALLSPSTGIVDSHRCGQPAARGLHVARLVREALCACCSCIATGAARHVAAALWGCVHKHAPLAQRLLCSTSCHGCGAPLASASVNGLPAPYWLQPHG